jgi:hypothetical protein
MDGQDYCDEPEGNLSLIPLTRCDEIDVVKA